MKRKYPTQPLVGVGAVIIHKDKILLVKRGSEPGKNRWSIPGGLVKLGEKVHDTIIREVKEETNLDVAIHGLVDVVDNLVPDNEGRLRYHFIILDFFASPRRGTPQAGSDVLEAQWVPFNEVEAFALTGPFRDFFRKNRQMLQHLDSTFPRKTQLHHAK
ncbi:MAG: NUDIX hydrolase [Candidatus Bathyarchaeota archaeon]|nr:MAG: NUDIX hydrolase [Candidatus Bathyarchaeota archaeon]